MNTIQRIIGIAAVFSVAVVVNTQTASSQETLASKLKKAKWDAIIGTWVDPETKGKKMTTSYEWKIKDQVVEINTKDNDLESTALMGVNGKTGDIFHMGADSSGTSSLGNWSVESNGDAVLGFVYTTATGQEGMLSIRQRFQDKNTLQVTIELQQPVKYNLVRKAK